MNVVSDSEAPPLNVEPGEPVSPAPVEAAPSLPPVSYRVFWQPKSGNTDEQYEDAWAINAAGDQFALADGASESVFAGRWAGLLARQVIAGWPDETGGWREWIRPAQEEWQAAATEASVPWYVAAKVREGAYSTLLGLWLTPPATAAVAGTWIATAIGDCILFHIRMVGIGSDKPSTAAGGWPISNPDEFGTQPWALSTNPEPNERIWQYVSTTGGEWWPGDIFVLASDALAQWIMRAIVPENRWGRFLRVIDGPDDSGFRELVARQRELGVLRDDDLTLLLLRTQEVTDA